MEYNVLLMEPNNVLNNWAIVDQLDMQYWDSVNDTTTWKDHVAAIKAAHPKP